MNTEASPPLRNCMVVDDDASIRNELRYILEKMEFDVLEVDNGIHAIAILKEAVNPPTVILLDQAMPGMDGLTLLKQIKASDGEMARSKVIMVTATGTYNLGVEAIKFGATDFIVKPFQPVLIKHAVETALDQIKLEKAEEERKIKEIEAQIAIKEGVGLKNEINSPLQSILGYLSILEQGKNLKQSINGIRQSVGEVESLLEEFLKKPRVETSGYPFTEKMTDTKKPGYG